MGMMTFVVEFEDGKEPPVSSRMKICGGSVVSAAWSDYRDYFFSEDERDAVLDALAELPDGNPLKAGILHRLDLMTS
ncbi:hypothetical protein ACIAEU_05570 [Enterobacter kobei]|uniref:hypothetical protein n=1 Tax=Enterobacter kobei TaxID=208224 RepID=UPI003D6DBCD5